MPSRFIRTTSRLSLPDTIRLEHRHLREIDPSLAIVCGLAGAWTMALNPGANQFSANTCFIVAGNINNCYCQQTQAGQVNERSTYLDVYGLEPQKLLCSCIVFGS